MPELLQHRPTNNQPLFALYNRAMKNQGTTITASSEQGGPFTADRLGFNDTKQSWRSGNLYDLVDGGAEYVSLFFVFNRAQSIGHVSIMGDCYLPIQMRRFSGAPGTSAEIVPALEYTHPEILQPFETIWTESFSQGMPIRVREKRIQQRRFLTGVTAPTVHGVNSVEVRFDIRDFKREGPGVFARIIGRDAITARFAFIGREWEDLGKQTHLATLPRRFKDNTKLIEGPNGDLTGQPRQGVVTEEFTFIHKDLPDTPPLHRTWPEFPDFHEDHELAGSTARMVAWANPHDPRHGWRDYSLRHMLTSDWSGIDQSQISGKMKLREAT